MTTVTSTSISINDLRLYPANLKNDKHHTLDGMLVLKCLFCKAFQTPIEYDVRVHLLDKHRENLLRQLSLPRGSNMEYRTNFVVDKMKQVEPKIFYDHKIAEFYSIEPDDETSTRYR